MTDPGAVNAADTGLLGHLGQVARAADGPPEHVYEAARAALSLRRLDSELALLVADSAASFAAGGLSLVGVRGGGEDVRLLSFEVGDIGIELQVTAGQAGRMLLGQVVGIAPGGEGSVRLETPSAPTGAASLDGDGGFAFDGVSGDLVRLHVQVQGRATVTTTWVSLT